MRRNKQPQVIVIAPHHCITSQRQDPGCDKNAGEFARKIGEIIQEYGLVVRTIISQQERRVCDLNRAGYCTKNSIFRKTVTGIMKTSKSHKIPVYLFEIHTFPHGRAFHLPEEQNPDTIVLFTHGPSSWEQRVVKTLKSTAISGDPVKNDIAFEAEQKQWKNHVLIELRENLKKQKIKWIARRLGILVSQNFKNNDTKREIHLDSNGISVHQSAYKNLNEHPFGYNQCNGIERKYCEQCAGPAMFTCSMCLIACYCSKDHQRQHWYQHQEVCHKQSKHIPTLDRERKRK